MPQVTIQSKFACGHSGDVQTERVKKNVHVEYAKLFEGICPECMAKKPRRKVNGKR